MKLYQFNFETGVYEGEIFGDSDTLRYDEGVTPVPPPPYGPGHVPVFDVEKQTWRVMAVSVVRQLLQGRLCP